MRTIKFRGKEIETNQWVYGDLLQCPNKYPTIRMWEEAYPIARSIDFVVFPDTIGQFTGLHDKNGREIYEGDIISTHLGACEVIHSDYGWAFCTREENKMNTRDKLYYHTFNAWSGYIECGFVIGNIHDNPELMKGGEV